MRTVLSRSRSRAMPAAWWLVTLSLAGLAAGGCARLGLTAESAHQRGFVRCVNKDSGYSIAYPVDWKTNTGGTGPVESCRLFHPAAVPMEPGTEEPPLAVSVKREAIPFDSFLHGNTGPGAEVVQQEQLTLAGQPAVRLEVRSTEQSTLPPGTLQYLYAVKDGDGVVRVGTVDAPGLDYEHDKTVVDQMVKTLELR
ncbi:MAG: hypothetical protein ACXU86_23025 [Archangium sp.]